MSKARRQRAFTLIELVAVIAIVGALAIAAIPALGTLTATRRAALGNEVERRLLLARAWAMSTGQPAGLRFDLTAQTLQMQRIVSDGDAPTPMPGVTGSTDADSTLVVGSAFAGASVQSVSTTPSGDTAVWFDYTGTPQARLANGKLQGSLTADAVVTLTGGATVTVRALSGAIEK